MIAETAAVVAIASKVVEATKGILSQKVDAEVKKELNDIMDSVISLKCKAVALVEKYGAVLQERDQWKQKANHREENLMRLARYERKELIPGIFVRALKESEKTTEPEHYLCDNCYTEERESTLQREESSHGGVSYFCPKCGTRLPTKEDNLHFCLVSPAVHR